MPDYIHHVTLNTGHAVRQRRADVGEPAIAALADTLDGLLSGARLPMPGHPGYLLNASHHGHDLIVTLWGKQASVDVPILTTATALKSRSAPAFWRMLHDTSTVPLATRRDDPPKAPWTADRVEIGALTNQAALAWTGDFSRCLAWTWWSYRRAA